LLDDKRVKKLAEDYGLSVRSALPGGAGDASFSRTDCLNKIMSHFGVRVSSFSKNKKSCSILLCS
jgi:hypothetical protein